MEKEIGKIKKNDTTDIIVRIDEYKGKKGLTVREYVTSEKYTGFSKSGTRIPADEFLNFRDMINSVNLDDLTSTAPSEKEESEGKLKPEEETEQEEQEKPKKAKKPKKEKIEEQEEEETQEQETVDEAEVKEESEEDKESEEESEEAE